MVKSSQGDFTYHCHLSLFVSLNHLHCLLVAEGHREHKGTVPAPTCCDPMLNLCLPQLLTEGGGGGGWEGGGIDEFTKQTLFLSACKSI